MSAEDKVIVSGFGDDDVNGTYVYEKDADGYAMYRKDSETYLIYQENSGPESHSPAYYLVRVYKHLGSVKIEKKKYRLAGSNPESATGWQSLMSNVTDEDTVGTTVFDEGSSSSQSSSSESVGNVTSSSSSLSSMSSSSTSSSSESVGNVSSSSRSSNSSSSGSSNSSSSSSSP